MSSTLAAAAAVPRRSRSPARATAGVTTHDDDAAMAMAMLSVEAFAREAGLDARALAADFWADVVPSARRVGRTSTWATGETLPAMAMACRARWGAARTRAFELIVAGLTLRLMPPLEELHMRHALPRLGGASGVACAPSYFHLVLAAHCIILRGRPVTSHALAPAATLADAPHAGALVSIEEVDEFGMGLLSLFWTEKLLFHARKHWVAGEIQRKYNAPMRFGHPALLPGFLTLLPQLASALRPLVWSDEMARRFPQWRPPGPLGDWVRVSADERLPQEQDRAGASELCDGWRQARDKPKAA